MTTARTRPWPDIVRFYRSIPWAGAMADLAEAISSSRHGADVYALTSMHTLIVAQTPEFEPNTGVLRIEPVLNAGCITAFRFEYMEEPSTKPRWTREYGLSDGLAAFERFIARVHWFVEYHGWIEPSTPGVSAAEPGQE